MKIISSFKDYYDYLQGIWGIDEKLILDRTNYFPLPFTPPVKTKIQLFIGEYLVEGIWIEDKFLYGEAIEKYNIDFVKPRYYIEFRYWNKKNIYYQIPDGKYSHVYVLKEPMYLGDNSPTWKNDTPILIDSCLGKHSNPILREYNLASYISPEDIWRWLSEWLSKKISKLETQNIIRTDKEKIESKGFDNKTSFRGK